MLLLFVLWVAFGGLCAYIADQKGRSALGWFFAGLFFGLFGLVAIIAVPNLKAKDGV